MTIKNVEEDAELSFADMGTGEVLDGTKLNVKKGDRIQTKIITKKQQEYNDTHTKNFNKNEPYVKFYSYMMPYLQQELTNAEWMFLCLLCRFVSYEDCILRPHGRKPYKAFDGVSDIAKALKVSENLCYKRLKSLYKKQLIIILKTEGITNYAVNPYIFFRGTDIENSTLAGFEDTRWGQYNINICEEE